jgi:hypothetical protein
MFHRLKDYKRVLVRVADAAPTVVVPAAAAPARAQLR